MSCGGGVDEREITSSVILPSDVYSSQNYHQAARYKGTGVSNTLKSVGSGCRKCGTQPFTRSFAHEAVVALNLHIVFVFWTLTAYSAEHRPCGLA